MPKILIYAILFITSSCQQLSKQIDNSKVSSNSHMENTLIDTTWNGNKLNVKWTKNGNYLKINYLLFDNYADSIALPYETFHPSIISKGNILFNQDSTYKHTKFIIIDSSAFLFAVTECAVHCRSYCYLVTFFNNEIKIQKNTPFQGELFSHFYDPDTRIIQGYVKQIKNNNEDSIILKITAWQYEDYKFLRLRDTYLALDDNLYFYYFANKIDSAEWLLYQRAYGDLLYCNNNIDRFSKQDNGFTFEIYKNLLKNIDMENDRIKKM